VEGYQLGTNQRGTESVVGKQAGGIIYWRGEP